MKKQYQKKPKVDAKQAILKDVKSGLGLHMMKVGYSMINEVIAEVLGHR